MKKLLSKLVAVILVLALLFSTVIIASAQEVVPDRSGMMYEITHYNPEYPTEGVSEQEMVDNHVMATSLLCQAIQEVTYVEIQWFDINKLYVGLPYSSVDLVSQLDTVVEVKEYDGSYVTSKAPEEKISDYLNRKIASCDEDTKVDLTVGLCYNQAIYYGYTEEDFADPQDFLDSKRATDSEYYTTRNQDYFEKISACVDVELNSVSKNGSSIYLSTTLSQVDELSKLAEVSSIDCTTKEYEDIETEYLYENKFGKWIIFKKYDPNIHSSTYEKYFDYDELYTHYTDNNEVDWVLISAKVDMYDPGEDVLCRKFGNRVLRSWSTGLIILQFGLCIYDSQEDTFYDLYHVNVDDYDGLVEVIEMFEFGRILGDVDSDGEISILDATAIQMYLAHLIEYDPLYNDYTHINALGDVDGDSEMSVLDATHIQLQLAQLI